MIFSDGDISDRMDEARQKARDIYYGEDLTYESLILRFTFILAREYNMPLFHEYFKERTLEELILEIEMIKLSREPQESKMSEIMNNEESKKELESIFDDWDSENNVDLSNIDSYNEGDKIVEEFLNSGEFIGENK